MSVGNILEESWVYQNILKKGHDKGFSQGEAKGHEEGKHEALVQSILRFGSKRLGSPDDSITTQLKAITDSAKLEQILDNTLSATSWSELLVSQPQ